jgi:hypothetical protein
MGYNCYQLHTKFHQTSFSQVRIDVIISVGFDVTDELVIRFSICKILAGLESREYGRRAYSNL